MLLKAHDVDAYIVTSQDAHCSEYVSAADLRRAWLTGFSGGAGTAVVTSEHALLWTDSRYFLQAARQIEGTEWTLMKMHEPGVPDLKDWISSNLGQKVVGIDPVCVPCETADDWRDRWGDRVTLKHIAINLVDAIWFPLRPQDPCNEVVMHPVEISGEDTPSKLRRLRHALAGAGAEAIIVAALDQVAWLFNLRGSDIEFNPVFFAYAIVTTDSVNLFLRALDDDAGGLPIPLSRYFQSIGVEARPYGSFFADVPELIKGKRVFIEPSSSSVAVKALVPPLMLVLGASPIEDFKAVKNDAEIAGLRSSCLRDSVALCQLLAEVEERICPKDGKEVEEPTEVEVAELMTRMRLDKDKYVGDSFPTISASGPNSALPHYHAEAATCRRLSRNDIFLIDTGAQFTDGTTDVTRTVHLGAATEEQRRMYTRVLQGHVALAAAVFPEGIPGIMLDTFARQHLWRDGLTYGHGTGHGIGAYLNCHEGPMGIGGGSVPGPTIQASSGMKRVYLNPVKKGHFLSDEPGCYKDGHFGFRIESDLLVVSADTPYAMGGRPLLKFECLTLVPMCSNLIEVRLLSADEIEWLNAYHGKVWAELEPSLAGASHQRTRDWLWRATRPL